MTKARTNASASPAVGRNMVINGAMNVAQRGTSATGVGATSNVFPTLDRYAILLGAGAGRLTMSQTADGPNGISANCLKLDCTTADTSIAAGEYIGIWQPLEGQNVQRIGKGVAGAKQVTVSFYVKANAAATYLVELEDADNGRTNGKLFPVTTDWVRQEIVFEADVDDGSSPLNDDNATSLVLAWYIHGGSNFTSGTLASGWANTVNANRLVGIDSFFDSTDNTLFITGVQMEVGPVATEFEQEDISTTLAKCQRYYHSTTFANGKAASAGGLVNSSTIGVISGMTHPVIMRAAPTAAINDVTHIGVRQRTAVTTCTNVTFGTSQRACTMELTVSSGLTLGDGCFARAINDSCTLSFDAEL